MQLQEWANANEPRKEMKFYKGYWRQITFVRDRVLWLFWDERIEADNMWERLTVISDHTSKSIKLPVYQVDFQNVLGLTLTLRDNFHGWIISVNSKHPLDCDFFDTVKNNDIIPPIYCEGFPEELVYGCLDDNNQQFTVRCHDDYNFYTFLYILKSHLKFKGIFTPKKY